MRGSEISKLVSAINDTPTFGREVEEAEALEKQP